jgi:hypothetical protein
MRIFIIFLLWVITGCSLPKEDEFESCIKKKVEKNGSKLTYFLQTKQRYINKDLLLKKIKVTLMHPDGKKINLKDSILFQRKADGTWECME